MKRVAAAVIAVGSLLLSSWAAPPASLDYQVARSCTVYPNYPKDGVVGNDIHWRISYPAGRPIPKRLLQGRSAMAADHYRPVDFRPTPGRVINDHKRIDSKGTLRDAANRFVIGNVFAGWHVHQTDERNAGWTKVYVPNAKRWGWVQDTHF